MNTNMLKKLLMVSLVCVAASSPLVHAMDGTAGAAESSPALSLSFSDSDDDAAEGADKADAATAPDDAYQKLVQPKPWRPQDTAKLRSLAFWGSNAKEALGSFVDVNKRDMSGNTQLHMAVLNSEFDVVVRLILAGANVSAANKFGLTPLHIAAGTGNVEIAGVLIENGAALNVVLPDGSTPLAVARQQVAQGVKGAQGVVDLIELRMFELSRDRSSGLRMQMFYAKGKALRRVAQTSSQQKPVSIAVDGSGSAGPAGE